MTPLLIDASVVIKWLVRKEDSLAATAWHGRDLSAPDFLLIELSNILWKKVRQKEIGPTQALAGFAEIKSMLNFVPTRGLELRALEIGLALNHPTYDCVYLALAETLDATIVTADMRLIRQCAKSGYAQFLTPFST